MNRNYSYSIVFSHFTKDVIIFQKNVILSTNKHIY